MGVQVLLALEQGALVVLAIEDGALTEGARLKLDSEISCVDLSPIGILSASAPLKGKLYTKY